MNRSEAALLLGHCAAFDNRTVGRVDAEAWAAALHDVPYDDAATAAVARFYGTPPKDPATRLWIQPHNVRSLRKTIRSERCEGFQYEPPAVEETPREYLARYRGQLEAVASGREPAPTGRPALDGGPHPSFVRELEARGYQVGRTMPDSDQQAAHAAVRRAGPFGIDCPACGAVMGHPCRIPGGTDRQPLGKPRPRPHPARIRAAAGETEPTADQRAADEQRRREASRRALARIETEEGQAS
jgi:hypothetical protein